MKLGTGGSRGGRVLATAVLAAVATGSGIALAGTSLPNEGDTQLGKSGGITYRKDVEPMPSPFGISFDTGCGPQTRKVLGGGARGQGPAPARNLSASLSTDSFLDPDSEPDDGWVGGGEGGDRLTVYAVCISRGLGRLSYIHGDEVPDGPGERVARVNCAGGAHAVGGGGLATSSHADTHMGSTYPVDGGDRDRKPDDGWVFRAKDPLGTVAGSVVCRTGSGVVYKKAVRRGIRTGRAGAATAKCPRGTSVVGGGGRVKGTIVNGRVTDTYPVDLRSDRNRVPDDGWRARSVNENGSGNRLTVHAICLKR